MDSIFFFIHVPKAAGVTFIRIMLRNFNRQFKHIPSDLYEGDISVDKLRGALTMGTHLRAVSSHRFTADLPYEFEAMKLARQYFKEELNFEKHRLYVSSYWKRGLNEEQHKDIKRVDAEKE